MANEGRKTKSREFTKAAETYVVDTTLVERVRNLEARGHILVALVFIVPNEEQSQIGIEVPHYVTKEMISAGARVLAHAADEEMDTVQ